MDLPIQCDCGKLRGRALDVEKTSGKRIVCYCDDCQTFAHFLKRSKDILDANGGTDIIPLRPALIKLDDGVEQLRCLRLSPKGMYRWYAGCCNSPIGNSMSPWVPYVGTFPYILKARGGKAERDKAIGPIEARVLSDFAIGAPPEGSSNRPPLSIILSIVQYLLSGVIKGLNKPSPFFTDDLKSPRVEPYVLAKDERLALKKLAGPRPA